MLNEGLARRALVLDLDVHQGDGTAAITRGDARIFTFSMHGAGNFPFRREAGGLNIELADGTGDAAYLAILAQQLPRLFAAAARTWCSTWPAPTPTPATAWASWR